MRPAHPLGLAVVALSFVAAACTGDDGDSGPVPPVTDPPATSSPTTTSVSPPSPSDPMTLGILLPNDENANDQFAQSLHEGVDTAVGDARAAGAEIRVVAAEEGSTGAETTDSINELIEEEVDAVVGPSSSTTALSSLHLLVDADIPTCSPTASSLLLDEYPDDEQFMRTIPSDSLQSLALAQLASASGAGETALAYVDDHYGRGLNEAAVDAIEGTDLTVQTHTPIPDDPDALGDAVDELLAGRPGTIIVLADGEQGARFLKAIDDHVVETPDDTPAQGIIVNDALRRPQPPGALADLTIRSSINGVSPQAAPSGADLEGPYSLNAYNCVTALAFGWHIAGLQQRPLSIPLVIENTSSGIPCSTYEICVNRLDEEQPINIHYTGPGGRLQLDPSGDPAEAQFDVFEFDEDGNDVDDDSSSRILVP